MPKKIDEILDKIDASQEVLSAMPKNNLKNIYKYNEKLEELFQEYLEYQNEITNRLIRRYKYAIKKKENDKIENIEKRLKAIESILKLLDQQKTSYEKLGLDKIIYKISKYYKENLENVNEQIRLYLTKFSEIGVKVYLEDFSYSKYVKIYMKAFFQELDKENINTEKLKQTFEEIYWKSPDIIVQIELNLRNIYLKKKVIIDKNLEKEKLEKLKKIDINEKEIYRTYIGLKRNLIEELKINSHLLQQKFLLGELSVKNFSEEKVQEIVDKLILNKEKTEIYSDEEIQDNITKFLNTLYEYQNYIKFKFILDDMKQYYLEKEKYKKSYSKTKKEIEKLERKLVKINKKNAKKVLFRNKKIEYRQTPEAKEMISLIKEKYKKLDMDKFYNKIYTELNNKSTLFDALKLASSYYVYLTNCIIKKFKNIKQEDIDSKIKELNDFLNNPFNNIINNTMIKEDNDFVTIIKDRYKLLNFNVEKEDFSINNISSLISKLENLQTAINLKKANVKVEELEILCEIKRTLQL